MIALKKTKNSIDQYLRLFEKRPVPEYQIEHIEKKLSIKIPEDLRLIMSVFDGYHDIAHQSLFSFNTEVSGWNIVEKTLFYRESDCKLPGKYLALREENESFIVLNTEPDYNNENEVIWCSLSDAYSLKNDEPLLDNPTIFPTFTDFFEFLLTEEEKERGLIPDHTDIP